MLQRQSQTAAFWRDKFEVSSSDLDFLYNLLLDAQTPKTLEELVIALIEEYVRRENVKIESELSKGIVYVPNIQYEVGQTLVFPALEFATGEVVSVRPGKNPEHGDFAVIQVQFEENSGVREFASGLHSAHRLNQVNGNSLLSDDSLLAPHEIYELYQEEINDSVLYALEEGERSEEFVTVDEQWLLADMLAEVHIGHLNIAEALIEMQGRPLSTDEVLPEMELDANVSHPMQRISIEHGLTEDERFDRVYRNGSLHWYLNRLEPAEVVRIPLALRPTNIRYNRALLSVELLQTEWELDDEWGESTLSSELPSLVPNTTLTLTYPHRRSGTLPLNGRTRNFFPSVTKGKSIIKFVDGRWGNEYTGWVVSEGRYVAGLSKWMDDHEIPTGALITLERSADGSQIVVDYRARRPKREWARIATPDLGKQQLQFEMNKIQVACEYDEHMIVADTGSAAIDELRQALINNGVELQQIIDQIVPELTKLNPQGTVHAKSVYSGVNVIRRCPPGPIFYMLISNRRFRDVGGGFFSLA